MSYLIRKAQTGSSYFPINKSIIEKAENNEPLPKPVEQADNLILWLGSIATSPEDEPRVWDGLLQSVIGGQNSETNKYIADHLAEQGLLLITKRNVDQNWSFKLKFKGWQHYEKLKQTTIDSRNGFVAMAFNPVMEGVLKGVFEPAIKAAGFSPFSLAHPGPAGLIDDRMRVEIRKCRFMIADLSHDNRGAYWEAGFAEGLGRPVIYTCDESAFDKVHFDTSHLNTIKWKASDFPDAIERLKATIRATLPTEAKLSD